jgi:hypothetical protein
MLSLPLLPMMVSAPSVPCRSDALVKVMVGIL